MWRESARALLPLLAASDNKARGGTTTCDDSGSGGAAVGVADGGSRGSGGVSEDDVCDDMPDVVPVNHPRGGGVACLASGTWRVREWWYSGETLSSARQRQRDVYTVQMDSEGGGGGLDDEDEDGGDVAGRGGGDECRGDDEHDDDDDEYDEYDVGGGGGGGTRRRNRNRNRSRGWGGTRGEFVAFGEDGVDAFNLRGWIYPLGQGETTSQNMASASVWGTDAENSESVAEFLAKHAVSEDTSPAGVKPSRLLLTHLYFVFQSPCTNVVHSYVSFQSPPIISTYLCLPETESNPPLFTYKY